LLDRGLCAQSGRLGCVEHSIKAVAARSAAGEGIRPVCDQQSWSYVQVLNYGCKRRFRGLGLNLAAQELVADSLDLFADVELGGVEVD
jgi:hypothetical protein